MKIEKHKVKSGRMLPVHIFWVVFLSFSSLVFGQTERIPFDLSTTYELSKNSESANEKLFDLQVGVSKTNMQNVKYFVYWVSDVSDTVIHSIAFELTQLNRDSEYLMELNNKKRVFNVATTGLIPGEYIVSVRIIRSDEQFYSADKKVTIF